MKAKIEAVRVDPLHGWGMRVGGPRPYVANVFYTQTFGGLDPQTCAETECTQSYHKAVPVVLLTLADYRRLLRAAKGGTKGKG
jgi:hypothetical protein